MRGAEVGEELGVVRALEKEGEDREGGEIELAGRGDKRGGGLGRGREGIGGKEGGRSGLGVDEGGGKGGREGETGDI